MEKLEKQHNSFEGYIKISGYRDLSSVFTYALRCLISIKVAHKSVEKSCICLQVKMAMHTILIFKM